MKKRILALLLCTAMVFSICGCGDSNANGTENLQAEGVDNPTVEKLADYSDFSVVLSGQYEITDELVNYYFTEVLYNAGAGMTKVTDRDTVQEGDIVEVDYTGYLNGEAFEGGSTIDSEGNSNPTLIDVSNNCGVDMSSGSPTSGYIDGFSAGIIGGKVGETVSSDVTFPEDYGNTELAGQLATFEYVIHAIYTEVTPETITDEYVAENLSSYDVATVEEFMVFLKEDLAYNYTMNYIIENSTYDISESYLNYRLEDYQQYFEDNYCSGTDLETYLSYYGYTVEEMQVQWLEELQTQIKAELIFSELVAKRGLTLDEAAHEAYIKSILAANSYFKEAADIYKYVGAGSASAGEVYLKNQDVVRDSMLEEYNNWLSKQ